FCFAWVRPVKVFDRVNDRVLDFGGDVVTDGDQVVGAHKALTSIGEFTVGDAAADGFPVMPIHHDDRRFTTQLQSDGCQLPSGALIHPASNGFRARVEEVVQLLGGKFVQGVLSSGHRDDRARVQVFGQNGAQ